MGDSSGLNWSNAPRGELASVPPPATLVCAECQTAADERARGWRAFLAFDPDEDEFESLVIFCPGCAESEFGIPSEESRHRE
ncbi:MAG: hypothetical protein ICV59_05640 [Thermoleophilia bacterium]|nr:hypothetical protein [Thermoleophilia bacterium]